MKANAEAMRADHELSITMWLDERVTYSRPAAMLKEEGLIPPGPDWPRPMKNGCGRLAACS